MHLGMLPVTLTARHSNSTIKAQKTASTSQDVSRRYIDLDDIYPERRSSYSLRDCHPSDSADYIYFTLISPDGSPALDSQGEKALYHVRTSWKLTYRDTIRKALFDDPREHPSCPKGHCTSDFIPGTQLRLEHVKNLSVFRAGWHTGHCGYIDNIQKYHRMQVSLGELGYLDSGAVPRLPVVDFVEQQMLSTYPTLEIGLLCGFSVGSIPASILLMLLLEGLLRVCGCIHDALRAIVNWARAVPAKIQEAWTKARDRRWSSKPAETILGVEFDYLQLGSGATNMASPPPVYTEFPRGLN